MAPQPDLIPLDSPLRTHPKRGLPPTMAATSPHGHISGHARTAAQQKAFDHAKARILRTMTAEEIEGAYWDTVQKINTILEDDQKKTEEVQREIDKLKDQRDLERRLFKKAREEKEQRRQAQAAAAAAPPLAPTSAPMEGGPNEVRMEDGIKAGEGEANDAANVVKEEVD